MEFTQEIFDRINSFDTIKAGCKAIADETGCNSETIRKDYNTYKRKVLGIYKKESITKRDKELLEELSKNPDNLQEVFRKLAVKYNISHYTLQGRYYRMLKNNPNHPVFTLVSKKSGHINVKNNIGNKYPKHKTNHSFIEQTWGKIKYFINNILK